MSISKFKVSLFLLIVVGVVCGSLNFFRIFQAMTVGYNTLGELWLPLLFTIIHFSYLVVSNYIAQKIMDHNNHVFTTIYNVQWYMAPLNVQKMILFLLQRGSKIFTLKVGGLIVGSLETAVTILSTAVSYFTFLYTVQ